MRKQLFIAALLVNAYANAQPTGLGPGPGVQPAGGLSSNSVYNMIINYSGGSTGGVTSAQATNIANYQIGLSNGNYIARSSGWGTNLSLNGSLVTTNQTGMTNSKVALIDGGIHLPSALFGGSWALPRGTNYYGGQLNWWHQTDTFPPPSEGGTTYTPMGAIGTFEQWGGAAVSAISPWMLITAPNIRFENGYGAGYGEIALGNEDAAGSIYLNWNRGPTLSQYDTANYKGYSIPLSFEADVTDASVNHKKAFPGIIGYAPNYNANSDPTSGLLQGELWFQSLTAYRVNGGWAQNGANAFGSNTVFRMRTNMVTFDGSLGVNGTSKTHINGGSITNTDILTKIIGTDSNGKFTGATLSGLTWDGTTLGVASTGAGILWGTNAVDGKITNILGGVSVGASSLNVSNGTASFINLLNSPATPRIMVGGNQTAFTTINTNSIAGTNGSGFFVHYSSGNSTNSGNIQTATLNTTAGFTNGPGIGVAGSASVAASTNNNALLVSRASDGAVVMKVDAGANALQIGTLQANKFQNQAATVEMDFSTSGRARMTVGSSLEVPLVIATNGFISPGTSELAAIKSQRIEYPTNLVANIAAPNLTKMYAIISTNNNFAITGLTGVNTGASDTNVQVCVRHYQNTSGSVKTITIPVSWTNVIGPQEYTLYFTNVGTLSIERYPGLATNYVFTSN